jgi:carotenoid cleavage dioxygenase-like enzyme
MFTPRFTPLLFLLVSTAAANDLGFDLLMSGVGAPEVFNAQLPAAANDLGFDLLMSGVGAPEVFNAQLPFTGTIPTWLQGTFIQTGGGRFEWPTSQRNLTNAGDGYAKLDVFTFHQGTVKYTSKFATSSWYNQSEKIQDIAPSLTFGVPSPPRKSDKEGLPNVLAANDNLAVNVVTMQDRILMLSDRPGSIEYHPDTLEFDKIKSSMPGPFCDFKDIPSIPLGMMASFGAAHPLWTGSSLDGSGDAYGLLNVQRLSTVDPRPEQLRLFKIDAEAQITQPNSTNNPWLTRRTITTLNITKGPQNSKGFAPYMHSFFLVTKPYYHWNNEPTHAVLVQHSMNIAMATLISGMGLKPISSGFDIQLNRSMIFHVIELSSGTVQKEIHVNMSDFLPHSNDNSMIVSHTINGYFDNNTIAGKHKQHLILDVIGYDFLFFDRFSSDEINNKTNRDHGIYSDKRAKTFRFTLDVELGVAVNVIELLPLSDWEFPIINEKYKGLPYCFAYGYEFRHNNTLTGAESAEGTEGAEGATGMASMAMVKYNMCGGVSEVTGKRDNQVFTRPYHYFSEPWFVGKPNGTSEDDGVVLVLALNGAVGKGVLFVLNATDLKVMATIQLPGLVNLKTHGRFVWSKKQKQLKKIN